MILIGEGSVGVGIGVGIGVGFVGVARCAGRRKEVGCGIKHPI